MRRFLELKGLLAGALMMAGAATADAADKLTVRMDFIAWGTHAAMHLASQKGWFKEAGLDVEVQDGTGSGNTIQLVAAGQADVGQVQLGVMAVAKEKGADLVSIAGWFRKSDLAVLVDRDADIDQIADLKGKSIVNFNGSPWSPYIGSFLRAGGLSEDDVDIVAVAPPALMSTYTAKQADAVMTTAPFGLPVIETARPSKAVLMADAGIAFPSYGLIVTRDTLAGKTDALRRLVEVEVRAWKYIYDGHVDEAVDAIIAQRPGMKLNPAVLKGQIELYRDFIDTEASAGKPFGMQTEADWARALADMEAAGIVAAGRKPADYFTNELVGS
ncbi:exported protein [Mesorhizobium sp. L-8-10]|uniref:ABC transporter substrate-binding protein n=1 Tax=unclassified Mesorhizobium TaxID=325217 RepID=UPI001928753D|nr:MULTISPECIES: ABC transporter substrate-binding protein [unclassified Mesorhizobium]BCH25282.1 exported protein [Mesorhizobium sp. L-8-3]BCH33292.1 exported protein [Mesorhizobium sp. L-8-10]